MFNLLEWARKHREEVKNLKAKIEELKSVVGMQHAAQVEDIDARTGGILDAVDILIDGEGSIHDETGSTSSDATTIARETQVIGSSDVGQLSDVFPAKEATVTSGSDVEAGRLASVLPDSPPDTVQGSAPESSQSAPPAGDKNREEYQRIRESLYQRGVSAAVLAQKDQIAKERNWDPKILEELEPSNWPWEEQSSVQVEGGEVQVFSDVESLNELTGANPTPYRGRVEIARIRRNKEDGSIVVDVRWQVESGVNEVTVAPMALRKYPEPDQEKQVVTGNDPK